MSLIQNFPWLVHFSKPLQIHPRSSPCYLNSRAVDTPLCPMSLSKSSFYPYAPSLWNHIPKAIVKTTSLQAFKSTVHSHLSQPVLLCLFPSCLILIFLFVCLFCIFLSFFVHCFSLVSDFGVCRQSFNSLFDQYWLRQPCSPNVTNKILKQNKYLDSIYVKPFAETFNSYKSLAIVLFFPCIPE